MKTNRIALDPKASTIQDWLVAMAEGNIGGLTVMTQIFKEIGEAKGFIAILNMDDMNIRGPQIWVGFKDHCKENLEDFVQCIKDRDPAMIDTINSVMSPQNFEERAISCGASAYHRKSVLDERI